MLNNILKFSFPRFATSRNSDTIYALATGVNTAVSIIRIGGNLAYRTFQLLNNCNAKKIQNNQQNLIQAFKIKPRIAHFKTIYNSKGNIIDQCILLHFPPPNSYNSEEIVQLHVHGSKAVVNRFRMADRGQFTKRALLNGKMNLIKAQSINDLIKSQSQFQRQIAVNNMLGKSEQFLDSVKKQLVRCLANNEAFIDFQQDQKDVRDDLLQSTKLSVHKVLQSIQKIIKNYKNLQILKEGINVTILGKPNAGKSTLINGLAQKQVSIVSDEPGTTRDILHAQIQCNGVMVNLYDTAGLRQTTNKIQIQGIKRAKLKIKQSQIKLLIIDLQQQQKRQIINENKEKQIQIINQNTKCNKNMNNIQAFSYDEIIDKNTILIINKSDKLSSNQKENIKYFIKIRKPNYIQLKQEFFEQNIQQLKQNDNEDEDEYVQEKYYINLMISAQQQASISKLLQVISHRIQTEYSLYKTTQQIYFTRQRYFFKLQKCKDILQKYILEDRPDICCEYLRQAINQVSEMFGRVDVEDMLDVLFRQFCIGK